MDTLASQGGRCVLDARRGEPLWPEGGRPTDPYIMQRGKVVKREDH